METKKDFIEKIFVYPSFKFRFSLYSILLITVFIFIGKIALIFTTNKEEVYQTLNLIIQLATLVAGAIAAYFALRQLTESRYSNLSQLGLNHLRAEPQPRYASAIKLWKDALYIKADTDTFLNLLEALILNEQHTEFDMYASFVKKNRSFRNRVLVEPVDHLVFYYLLAARQLVVENMGMAKTQTKELVTFAKKENLTQKIGWDFSDFLKSETFGKLTGDHKLMAENIMRYLKHELAPEQSAKFEGGNYTLL